MLYTKTTTKKLMEIAFEISMGIALIHQLDGNVDSNSLKYGVIIFRSIIWIIRSKGYLNRLSLRVSSLHVYPYILFGFLSIPMWGIRGSEFTGGGYISFVFSNTIYIILRCIIVIITLDLFGKRAFKVMFRALILSQLIILIYVGYLYGYGNLLDFCLTGVFKAVNNTTIWGSALWSIGWALEVHDNTFAFGFFLLYFIYCEKDKRDKIKGILISIFFMYIGLKRIQLVGIAVVILINYIFKFIRTSYHSSSKIYVMTYLVISAAFIGVIKFSPEILSGLDNHRLSLYNFLGSNIKISSLVLGTGFGSINYYLQFIDNTTLLGSSHSDLTRIFIELGLIVFIIWIYYFHVILPIKIEKETSSKSAGKLAFLCTVYIFITYFIDNTLQLYATQIMYMFIPIYIGIIDKQKN